MNKTAERTLKQINKDRRRFLDMLGKAGVSTSLLKASSLAGAMMGARFAEAQTTSAKKMILIYHPNGSPNGRYLNGVAMNPFKDHSGNVATLEMTISKPGGHGNIHWAAGATEYNSNLPNSSSINMQVAKVVGNMTPQRSIQLGVLSLNESGIDFLNGTKVSRENSPQDAFRTYFNGTPPPASGGPSPAQKRLDVLTANKKALDVLQKKLGQEERYALDSHMNYLTDLERRLMGQVNDGGGSSGGGGGSACSSPTLTTSKSPLQIYKSQGDIAVAALKCGLTNVVSIQFNETQASWVPNDGTPDAVAWSSDHHQANHGNGSALLPAILEYMNKGVAHIISRLKAEGIFNQTVVVVVSEMGDGQDHSAGNGPIIVASGLPNFRARSGNIGASHDTIFGDVFRLMGLESSIGGMLHNYGAGGHVIS